MKKVFLFLLLSINMTAFAQDFDNLMTQRYLTCNDISVNCISLFMDYYSENKLDTANNLLKYWENKCGKTRYIHCTPYDVAVVSQTLLLTVNCPLLFTSTCPKATALAHNAQNNEKILFVFIFN